MVILVVVLVVLEVVLVVLEVVLQLLLLQLLLLQLLLLQLRVLLKDPEPEKGKPANLEPLIGTTLVPPTPLLRVLGLLLITWPPEVGF